MKLSILMPVYNERTVVDRSISLVLSAPLPEYLSWLARKLRPHVGDAVLEVGAGIGNIAGRLMGRRVLYVAAEKDPLHLHALRNRFLRTPNVVVQRIDPEVLEDLAGLENCFDTVLCLNVLEY